MKTETMKDHINENRFLIEPLGMNCSNLENETLFLSLPPEMGEMAQIFISEIEWLAVLKCHARGLSTSLFLTEQRCLANLLDSRWPVSPM